VVFDAMFADLRKEYTAMMKSQWLREKLKAYGPQSGITAERFAAIDGHIDRETSWQVFGAHGFVWTDYAGSAESAEKERRIIDAFLVAGLEK
jgi:hypothetical protein